MDIALYVSARGELHVAPSLNGARDSPGCGQTVAVDHAVDVCAWVYSQVPGAAKAAFDAARDPRVTDHGDLALEIAVCGNQ